MVDHPDGLGHSQTNILQDWPGAVGIFVKIDAGYHRAGISIGSPIWTALLSNIKDCESQDSSKIYLKGLYSHMGSSYDGNCPEDALRYLHLELQSLSAAAADTSSFDFKIKRLTLSVGATPTAMGAQSLVSGHEAPGTTDIVRLIRTIQERHDIEIHAGVYPLLDLQQIATHSRISFPSGGNSITTADIGIRVLVEVASVYSTRDRPEALIAAGTLALGREPCKSYPGWGIVTAWDDIHSPAITTVYDEQTKMGWIIARISQEHGILQWQGPLDQLRPLHVGQRLLLWPNHACITGAGHDWYLVVNSDNENQCDRITEVWPRWRGW